MRVTLHDHSSPEMLAGSREGTPLRSLPIVAGVPPGHPLARRRSVTLKQVLAEPLIAFGRKNYPD
ncbi:MAG: LysR substrate-binding domain-containing protein [Opitutaceae bacterium]|nr:LysR substrate-binding domain-containing protein [Opitutaceae bacterium]